MRPAWFLLFGLGLQVAGLALPGAAHANDYYGAPYSINYLGELGPYQSEGEAVTALSNYLSAGCPTCTIYVRYFDTHAKDSQLAAQVTTDPTTTGWGVWATELPNNPIKTAGSCNPNNGGNGDKTMLTCPGGITVHDPINASTGNKYIQETDAISDSSLTFRRFYNSQSIVPSGSLGSRWRHSFDRFLEINLSSPGMTGTVNTILLDRPDGRREQFQLSNGVWTAEADNPDVLTEQDDATGHAIGYTVFMAGPHQVEKYSATGLLQSITDLSGTVTTFTYSTATTPLTLAPKPNLLLTVTDPNGRNLNFTYDSNARLQSAVLPDGGVLAYAYDSNNNLASVTYPDTHTRQYLYNEQSLTSKANLPHSLTGIIDENGGRYQSTGYNSSNQAISDSLATGAEAVTLTYRAYGGPTTLTMPLSGSTNLGIQNYLGAPKVTSSSQPCGTECNQPWKSLSYDPNGWPSSSTDFNGNVTGTTFSGLGLETLRIESKGSTTQRTITTTWDSTLRKPLTRTTADATGALVAQSAWVYNARGQMLASCDMDPTVPGAASYTCAIAGTPPVGVRRSTFAYCDAVDTTQCPLVGLLLSVDGPRLDVVDVTQYRYYLTTDESGCGTVGGTCHRAGDLYQVTDALGHVSAVVAYDKNGRVVRQRRANGVITDLTYSPRGWLLTRTVRAHADGSSSAQDATTTVVYDPTGTVHQVTDPDGVTVTYTYDGAHRLTDITDASGNRIHYTLDASGNRLTEQTFDTTNTVRRSLTRKYNTLGQLVSITDGLGQVVYNAGFTDSYDANGNLVHTADALGVQRKLGYDGLNRLVSTLDNYNGADAATKNTSTVVIFDALDRLNGISDPDTLNTTYDYDGLSNAKALHSPDTGTASPFVSDAAGNRIQQTDANGITSTSAYDALNRVTSVNYADTSLNATYAYDEADSITGCNGSASVERLTRLIENAVTTVWCYDNRGNVTQKRQTQGSQVDTTSYSYTLANRLSSVTSPSQTITQYSRNALGRISGVSVTPSGAAGQAVVSAISYLPFGPITSYALGNGQILTRSYDANYRLTDLTSPLLALHFALDAAGNIKALGNAPGANPAIETYAYDPLYRLAAVNSPTGTAIEVYTYSKTGDRLSKASGGLATGAYGYQSGTHWLKT
ncbi:DUF6531 domain-containing protein, partial [Dyella silvatica]|uniref:DUF6531 domain-containing protein n=1 Tax=Dyella silvatica TaxID=2992128 RepID=UPI002256ABC8